MAASLLLGQGVMNEALASVCSYGFNPDYAPKNFVVSKAKEKKRRWGTFSTLRKLFSLQRSSRVLIFMLNSDRQNEKTGSIHRFVVMGRQVEIPDFKKNKLTINGKSRKNMKRID